MNAPVRLGEPMVDVTRINDDCCMGWVGRVSIAIWRNTPNDMVEWFRTELQRGVLRHKKGLAHVPVLDPGTPPIGNDARKGLMQIIADYEQQLDVVAPIIASTGFRGAAVRAMAAGMVMMLPRSRVQIKICADHTGVSDCLLAALPDHQPRLTPLVLSEAILTMRTRWKAKLEEAAPG